MANKALRRLIWSKKVNLIFKINNLSMLIIWFYLSIWSTSFIFSNINKFHKVIWYFVNTQHPFKMLLFIEAISSLEANNSLTQSVIHVFSNHKKHLALFDFVCSLGLNQIHPTKSIKPNFKNQMCKTESTKWNLRSQMRQPN